MKRWTKKGMVLILGIFLLALFSCHYQSLRKNLDPENAEMLNKVAYLISQKEEKLFLELPESEREVFWLEFWKKRDPTPDTEKNELKQEYFSRIEEADRLFQGESRTGWLTDRGRIYVLYGSPRERLSSPLGNGVRSECSEVWYYGSFPVVFQDISCIGEFRLVTFDLTPIQSLNINYLSDPRRASVFLQGNLSLMPPEYLDFDWDLRVDSVQDGAFSGLVRIEIPFSRIWFTENNRVLSTEFSVVLSVRSENEEIVWEKEHVLPFEIGQDELKTTEKRSVDLKIPFQIPDETGVLSKGENRMLITLTNLTDKSRRQKEKILLVRII